MHSPHALLRFEVDGDDGSATQILFTPNPGLPEGPLQALASGGELSRVSLALSLETAHEDVVAVFDEIDAGIGGQVAQQIGSVFTKWVNDSRSWRSPIWPRSPPGPTTISSSRRRLARRHSLRHCRVVTGDERVDEIARMLAGDAITDEAKALAQRLLETTR